MAVGGFRPEKRVRTPRQSTSSDVANQRSIVVEAQPPLTGAR